MAEPVNSRVLEVLRSDGPRIHALLVRLTLRHDVAEDLMQELFLKLRDAEGFHSAANPTAYGVRAATNLAFQWRRTEQRRSTRESAHDRRLDESTAHAILEKQEEYELTLDALGQLSDLMREVIVLSRLDGLSNESVAEQIGKTPHQVRALISKAISQLRETLNPTRGANTP